MAPRIDLTLDCANARLIAEFWKTALGYIDEPPPAPFTTRDEDFEDADSTQAAAAYAALVEEQRLAGEAIAAAGLDDTCVHNGQRFSVRFLCLHLLQEYARHNGHDDLLGERIDGVTGA
ncbi:MAG TPA: DUF664 domain-containing protein [Amycolatopsis sp.]|nr:DUF664 domain-containing protein [Amycolatopsis sp.]